MNAGLLVDLPHLDETGAQSIGLFRTELQFMLASRFPRPGGAGTALPRRCSTPPATRPVTFRTLDIGGDKVLPYMKGLEEENPALGWRAIRIGLDKPGAAAHAVARDAARRAPDEDLRVMLPMVSTVDEFMSPRAPVRSRTRLEREPRPEPPRSVKLGVMVEVPSLLWQLDELAACADFLSVGSNDLHAISLRRRSRQQARRRPLRQLSSASCAR